MKSQKQTKTQPTAPKSDLRPTAYQIPRRYSKRVLSAYKHIKIYPKIVYFVEFSASQLISIQFLLDSNLHYYPDLLDFHAELSVFFQDFVTGSVVASSLPIERNEKG